MDTNVTQQMHVHQTMPESDLYVHKTKNTLTQNITKKYAFQQPVIQKNENNVRILCHRNLIGPRHSNQ